jgi:uncharacterized ferritin-like protein (DUF455 family)
MDVNGASTLGEACIAVLRCSDPREKVMAARKVARDWRLGRLAHRFDGDPPERPGRPDRPELLPPHHMPRRGKGGSERSRIAMIHALAHIEFVAIDLAFDLVARFGAEFPAEFADDWLRVGADEAMHFALLARRLEELDSHYGALPAHDGLWEAAIETAHDVNARLAIVPMVLEARALDITPETVVRFRRFDDERTARMLERIVDDEIRHVAAGTKWFLWSMNRSGGNPQKIYQKLVRRHFRGAVKPPFNDSARSQAGLTRDFYGPLAG